MMTVTGAALAFASLLVGEQPREIVTLDSPTPPKFTVSLSRNGQAAAAVCEDGMVRVWSLPSGRVLKVIDPHESATFTTAISDDAALVASADYRGGFTVRKTTTGDQIFHVQVSHYQLAMAFSPDGMRLALAPANEAVQIYSVTSKTKLLELPQGFGGAQAVAFSADGSRIVTAGSDTVVRTFDSRNGELTSRYADFLLEPLAATFTSDGKEMLIAGADKFIVFLNAANSAVIRKTPRLQHPVQSLEISPDGRFAAAWLLDPKSVMKPASALVLETASGRIVQDWLPPGPMAGSIWTEDGSLLAAVRMDHGVSVWRVR